jgi:hypothetical protein
MNMHDRQEKLDLAEEIVDEARRLEKWRTIAEVTSGARELNALLALDETIRRIAELAR